VTAPFSRLAVIGLGLLGGSVALAARRGGLAGRIVAAGRRRAPLEQALADGVVDEIADIAAAVRGADLVVLGTPVGSMARVLEQAAPHLSPGTLVTDVGSVKAVLADRLAGVVPAGVHYVGAHPMAGSHLRGVEHARSDLFDGACCVVTPMDSSDRQAVLRIVAFWRGLGARVTERDPVQHDVEVAWVSHAPHALAFAFAHAMAHAPESAGELAGSGFRDFTRIAQSDPAMWAEILHENRKALAGPLQTFARSLEELSAALESGDADARDQFLESAHHVLTPAEPGAYAVDGPEDARSGGDDPEIQADQVGRPTPRSVKTTND
jgi:prephenate dehydrogenase